MGLLTPAFLTRSGVVRGGGEVFGPVVLARVDNRLVHGQILSAWLPVLKADGLLVIDDEASRNALVRSAMEIAIPPDVRFDVVGVEEAAAAVQGLPARGRTIVLFRDVADVARALDHGLTLERINLGNVHFSHTRVPVSQSVYLSSEEVAQLERMDAGGISVEMRTLPSDVPVTLVEIRKRVADGSRG